MVNGVRIAERRAIRSCDYITRPDGSGSSWYLLTSLLKLAKLQTRINLPWVYFVGPSPELRR